MEQQKSPRPNRLINSRNPYLLQHAFNPVDWHPWSDEAFRKAFEEDKPVFLSIGYSTCHWCHVMEAESFQDPEVAALMNEVFVCVKVDREEHPDLDQLYMTVVQQMTGGGGWPMTIILTPDKKPFFAGTYLPKETRGGRLGLVELLERVREVWKEDRNDADAAAGQILDGLRAFLAPEPGESPGPHLVEEAYRQLARNFDSRHGGFGHAPKFPIPANLLFMLRYWRRTGNEDALGMVRRTLEAIFEGGVYDHLGDGIHRYSTDERWFAPHFEKMLYDQALVAMACTQAFRATSERRFEDMARGILAYALRDLKSPGGTFYSAEDADSEGEEGRFYTWEAEEIDRILDPEEQKAARAAYGITDEGNFIDDHGHRTGRNILHLSGPKEDIGRQLGMDPGRFDGVMGRVREKLFNARLPRPRPFLDTKIMTDWNGLMIAALAMAGAALSEYRFIDAAGLALSGILPGMKEDGEGLAHIRYEEGNDVGAFLDDYAFLLWGAVELYQAAFRPEHLETALSLAEGMISLFWDGEGGGFFFTPRGAGPPDLRLKPVFDGPYPSGNAVAAMNLLRLARITGRADYEEKVASLGKALGGWAARAPAGCVHLLSAFDAASGGGAEVVIAGERGMPDTEEMISAFHRSYLPNSVAAFVPSREGRSEILRAIPFARELKAGEGRATAFVCRNFSCGAPTEDPEEMLAAILEAETGSNVWKNRKE